MNNEKPKVYKRIIAFIIDLLIVSLLSGLLATILTNTEEYDKDTQKVLELVEKTTKGEITQEEYNKQYQELSYSLNVNSLSVTIISVGVTIVYYVIMLYFANGITLGKYIMKIRIISANDKKLNIFNYLLRSLIVNSLLQNIITIIMIKTLSKNTFISVYNKASSIFSLLLVVSFIFMMYREDGRGLHDLMGNTKVIDIKNLMENMKLTAEQAMVALGIDKNEFSKYLPML